MDFAEALTEGAARLEVVLNAGQVEAFGLYKGLLREWNERMNLTSLTDEADILAKHFLDSLTVVKYVKDGDRVADVGTGAGFPGVPIKIVLPGVDVTLLDSLKKRLTFLDAVVSGLGLEGVLMVHGRAEDVGRDTRHREAYNVVVSRAVADLTLLSEYCLPLVKVGGRFVAMKGPNYEAEMVRAEPMIKLLSGKVFGVDCVNIPLLDGTHKISRNIIIVEKVCKISKKYPRTPAELSKIYK